SAKTKCDSTKQAVSGLKSRSLAYGVARKQHIGVASESNWGNDIRHEFCQMLKSILASSIVTLMLSVSAFGTACELACGFAPKNSDCHTEQAQAQDSPTTMKMSDMDVPGMGMPDMAGRSSNSLEMVSSARREDPAHATLVDMNSCERQSCDQAQATVAQANCSPTAHCDANWAIEGSSY